MQAPDAIKRLVDTFDRNIFDYKNSAYKEAHVRQEFINPFWHELGWDMNNSAGLPSKLREVTHEDSVEIDGNRKSPDYGFRKGEHLKFYLEAKAPRIYLKEDISPAFQIKSYAWSGGLPVS